MSGKDNIDLVRRRFEALDDGNFEVLDELFSPEYELHPGCNAKGLSLDETKDLYRRLYEAFPDLKHSLDEQFEAGDKVVTVWTATGTHKAEFLGAEASGDEVTFSGINVYTVADGKFVRSDVSWDLVPVLGRGSLFDAVRGGA
jgi:steroid delta-isomerase-like uncharacterized protein